MLLYIIEALDNKKKFNETILICAAMLLTVNENLNRENTNFTHEKKIYIDLLTEIEPRKTVTLKEIIVKCWFNCQPQF